MWQSGLVMVLIRWITCCFWVMVFCAESIWADMPSIVTAQPSVRRAVTSSATKEDRQLHKSRKAARSTWAIKSSGNDLKKYSLRSPDRALKKPAKPSVVVVLDPGHGGKDVGARGLYGAKEKDINLQMALRIKYYLERNHGFKVILTRNGDRYYTRQQRVNVARRHRAKLFISLHSDAYHQRDVRGATIFTLSPRGTVGVASRWLSRVEKDLVSAGEVSVSDPIVREWLTDLSSRSTNQASAAAGNSILHAIIGTSKLHRPRIEYADFWVLKAPHVPSLLIETGFISNPQEAKLLMCPGYRNRLARAIADGIVRYFNS